MDSMSDQLLCVQGRFGAGAHTDYGEPTWPFMNVYGVQ